MQALVVANRRHLGPAPGGVQTCTREYLALLDAAGISVEVLPVDVDMGFITRVSRTIRTSPYTGPVSPSDQTRLADASRSADLVFLNQVNLSGGLPRRCDADELRRKTVLLSHGAEATDLLNLVRVHKTLPLSGRLRPTPMQAFHNVLADEIAARRGISAAVCLSPFDADFERWLGVRHVTWVPRTVRPAPLDWAPVANRFGFIGTLDHAPNLEGLVDILDEIVRREAVFELRVVGGPERLGAWLAQRYRSVTYLGPLDDNSLAREAATWSAFLNPIFCQARGCSTKLATALSWELPIVTTTVGRRGYVHREGDIPVADDPASFVDLMRSLNDPHRRASARRSVQLAARSTPAMTDLAAQFMRFLQRARLVAGHSSALDRDSMPAEEPHS